MKKIAIIILNIFTTCFLLFLCPLVTCASNATTSINSNSSVYIGNTVDIVLSVNTDSPIVAFQGILNYDTAKLELISQTSLSPFEVAVNGNKIGGMDMTGNISITGSQKIIKLTFKTKELGSTKISFTGSKQVGINGTTVSTSGCSKTINIVNPPSSNNNLSNLNVSNGSINFNKNTTSYNVLVDSNVTSITVDAKAEDSGAKISGTGTKSLSYGNNIIKIVVTAASGDKKIYTVNVNRKDSRSNNNYLSSIIVNGGSLNPSFSKDREEYNLDVPYSITDLDIKATPQDSRSKVSITGQNNLISEQTKAVKIYVTAENGSVKTYIINVTRGKDPNKVLSTNNYLSSLNISVGILSPEFNKEKETYIVYLPFEVTTINIDATVEDTKYGILKKEGPEKLSVGNNEYKITVTAEDESTRIYKILVVRAESVDGANISSNTYLKELKLENSIILTEFDKNIHLYSYKKTKDKLIINATAEDENSIVSISNIEDVYLITVTGESGEEAIYILKPNEKSNIITISIISLTLLFSGIVIGYIIGLKKEKTDKKSKKIFKRNSK